MYFRMLDHDNKHRRISKDIEIMKSQSRDLARKATERAVEQRLRHLQSKKENELNRLKAHGEEMKLIKIETERRQIETLKLAALNQREPEKTVIGRIVGMLARVPDEIKKQELDRLKAHGEEMKLVKIETERRQGELLKLKALEVKEVEEVQLM